MNVMLWILPFFPIKVVEFDMLWDIEKARLRYTNGLKLMLPHHCLIKLLKLYSVIGLRKFHVRYTIGL